MSTIILFSVFTAGGLLYRKTRVFAVQPTNRRRRRHKNIVGLLSPFAFVITLFFIEKLNIWRQKKKKRIFKSQKQKRDGVTRFYAISKIYIRFFHLLRCTQSIQFSRIIICENRRQNICRHYWGAVR